MTQKKKQDIRFEIEKTETGTLVRVTEVSFEEFDEAYVMLLQLSKRITEIDAEFILTQKIQQAKEQLASIWIKSEEEWRVSDLVSQKSHRIAISLLFSYPQEKPEAQIVRETNIPRGSVNAQLSGRVKSVESFFIQSNSGYTLSKEGIAWVLEEVLPFILGMESFES